MKRTNVIILLLTLVLVALLIAFSPLLGRGKGEVEQGQQMLSEARQLYADGNYSAARDTILSLRKRFPTALDARRQAILLMDSIELQLAEGDSLKTEFFRRKLMHDMEVSRK